MMPPQNRSGTSTAKCQQAMPIIAQTTTLRPTSSDRARLSQRRVAVERLVLHGARAFPERSQIDPAHHAPRRLVRHWLIAVRTAFLGLVVLPLTSEQPHAAPFVDCGNGRS